METKELLLTIMALMFLGILFSPQGSSLAKTFIASGALAGLTYFVKYK